MTKNAVLYVGLHKTGSTSIQSACRDNITALKKAGYFYPLVGLRNKFQGAPENHSALFVLMFKRKLKRFKSGVVCVGFSDNKVTNEFKSSTYNLLKNVSASNLLFAAEEISDLNLEELTDLREYFSRLRREVKIMCTIRSPAEWIQSMVASEVSNPRGPKSTLNDAINTFLGNQSILLDRVQNLQTVFPDIHFSSFVDVATHPQGVAGHFFESLGVSVRSLNYFSNQRAGDHFVRLVSDINEEIRKNGVNLNRNVIVYLERFWADCRREMSDVKFQIRRSEVQPLIPIIKKETDWLRGTFAKNYADSEIRFSEEPVVLNAGQRNYLLPAFGNAPEPLGSVVKKYISEH